MTAVWKVFREVPRRIPVKDERMNLLVRTIDVLGQQHTKPSDPQGICVWKGLPGPQRFFLEVSNGMFLGLPFAETS